MLQLRYYLYIKLSKQLAMNLADWTPPNCVSHNMYMICDIPVE